MPERDDREAFSTAQRLSKIELQLTEMRTELKSDRTALFDAIGMHGRVLYGRDDRPGLVLRVDRLEQSEGRRQKGFWALWTAVLTVGGGLVAAVFGGKGH